jgi:hypothetical protein
VLLSATMEDRIRTGAHPQVTTSFVSKSNSAAAAAKRKPKSWGVSATTTTMMVQAGLLAAIACQSTLTVAAAQGIDLHRRHTAALEITDGDAETSNACEAAVGEELNYNVAFHIAGIFIVFAASALGIMGTAAMASFKFKKGTMNVSTGLQVCLLSFIHIPFLLINHLSIETYFYEHEFLIIYNVDVQNVWDWCYRCDRLDPPPSQRL